MGNDGASTNYLRDLGALLRDLALQAKREYDEGRGSDAEQYLLGRLGALHEVVSLVREQSIAFGLPVTDLSLGGFDPDKELL